MTLVPQVASLMYHEVTDDPRSSGFQRRAALPYTYSRGAFARHLDAVAAAERRPELVSDIGLDGGADGRHVLLTFDDGGASALYAAEQLAVHGWKGHFFVVTAKLGERTFLQSSDLRTLRDAGHLVGTHSHTHPDIFRNLSRETMAAEWRTSRDMIESLLGEPCMAASVPGGDSSPLVLETAAGAGLRYLFTSEPVLRPSRVADMWVLGRATLKASDAPATVRELVSFRGWERAQLWRRIGAWGRALCPPLYAHYVKLRTREWTA